MKMTKKEIDDAIKKEAAKKEQKKETREEKKETKEEAEARKLNEKIKELTDTLQRVQADYENYKKRVERDIRHFAECANKDIIAKLLPVLDSFELAIKNKENKDDFIKGVELIYSSLFSMLEKEGLRPIKAEGKKFDPFCHEALISEKSDKEEGIVTEELQKGYMLKNNILRASKVKISKK